MWDRVIPTKNLIRRMILKDVPMIEETTTIHFPDVEASYFRSLLDFLYSGQTCVPATDVEHLHDLLDLLQIKPGVWRTGDKNGKETIEVLTRIFTENNQKLDDGHCHHHHTDLNSNRDDGDDLTQNSRRSKSRDSSPSQHSVKMERLNESSCDDDDPHDNDRDDDDEDENDADLERDGSGDGGGGVDRGGSGGGGERGEGGDHDASVKEELRAKRRSRRKKNVDELNNKIHDDKCNDENFNDDICQDVGERRRSSSDPVNLSLGYRERDDDDSTDGHIDVETIGNAPSKVSYTRKRI